MALSEALANTIIQDTWNLYFVDFYCRYPWVLFRPLRTEQEIRNLCKRYAANSWIIRLVHELLAITTLDDWKKWEAEKKSRGIEFHTWLIARDIIRADRNGDIVPSGSYGNLSAEILNFWILPYPDLTVWDVMQDQSLWPRDEEGREL